MASVGGPSGQCVSLFAAITLCTEAFQTMNVLLHRSTSKQRLLHRVFRSMTMSCCRSLVFDVDSTRLLVGSNNHSHSLPVYFSIATTTRDVKRRRRRTTVQPRSLKLSIILSRSIASKHMALKAYEARTWKGTRGCCRRSLGQTATMLACSRRRCITRSATLVEMNYYNL